MILRSWPPACRAMKRRRNRRWVWFEEGHHVRGRLEWRRSRVAFCNCPAQAGRYAPPDVPDTCADAKSGLWQQPAPRPDQGGCCLNTVLPDICWRSHSQVAKPTAVLKWRREPTHQQVGRGGPDRPQRLWPPFKDFERCSYLGV